MKTILDLHNIYYSYHTSHGETRALSNLSFSLAPGEFAAVVGPSGCGKSTLLSLICGLMKPQTGEILVTLSLEILRRSDTCFSTIISLSGGLFTVIFYLVLKSATL